MQEAGDPLLADPRLAAEQYVDPGRRGSPHQFQHLVNRRRFTDEPLATRHAAQGAILIGQALAFAFNGIDPASRGHRGRHHAGHREQKTGVAIAELCPSFPRFLVRQDHHAHKALLPEHRRRQELERWLGGCAQGSGHLAGGKVFEQVGVEERPHDLDVLRQPFRVDDGFLAAGVERADKTRAGVEGADRALQQLFHQLFFGQDPADGQRQIDQGLELQSSPVAIERVHCRPSVTRAVAAPDSRTFDVQTLLNAPSFMLG